MTEESGTKQTEYGGKVNDIDNGLGYPITSVIYGEGVRNGVFTDATVPTTKGMNIVARAHTHPNGSAPSPDDFKKMGDPGFKYKYSIIEAGSKRYTIEVINKDKADKTNLEDFEKAWYNGVYKAKANGMSGTQLHLEGAKALVKKYSDVSKLYQTVDKEKKDFEEVK